MGGGDPSQVGAFQPDGLVPSLRRVILRTYTVSYLKSKATSDRAGRLRETNKDDTRCSGSNKRHGK